MSTLTIKNARDSDSGTYTCEPSQLETAHVNLHVLECKCLSIFYLQHILTLINQLKLIDALELVQYICFNKNYGEYVDIKNGYDINN